MKKSVFFFLVIVPFLHIPCSASIGTAIKGTWNTITDSVSRAMEHSESVFIEREIDAPPKSRIVIKNTTGTVAIAPSKTSNKIFVEAEKRGKKSLLPFTQVSIQTKDLVTRIETKISDADKAIPVYYTITVPDNATVSVEQQDGEIVTRDIGCPLSLQISGTGSMTIENNRNSVTARALNGSITISQTALPEHASIFLEAYRSIKINVPQNINAQLRARTSTERFVTCELPITLQPITTKITREAMHNWRCNVSGDLGRGGPSIVLESTTGSITIKPIEKK